MKTQWHYLHTDHLGTPYMATNRQGEKTWRAYANAFEMGENDEFRKELSLLQDHAALAQNYDIQIAAGGGLNYRNVRPVAEIAGMRKLEIGHAIVGRAVLVGLDRAVREMKALL